MSGRNHILKLNKQLQLNHSVLLPLFCLSFNEKNFKEWESDIRFKKVTFENEMLKD